MIRKAKVTHIHRADHLGRTRITHPTLWEWRDVEGTIRYFDTKTEALAAKASQDEEL